LSPVCECSKALPPLLAASAEPDPLFPEPPLLPPAFEFPPAPPFPPPDDGFPDVFEPDEPTIEPLFVIFIVVPEPHPVSVFIAGVEALLPLTVTPLLIVKITGVLASPPAAIAAVLML
jgi:hypothetical protein